MSVSNASYSIYGVCRWYKMNKSHRVFSSTMIQLSASFLGGAGITVGLWLMMGTTVVARFPMTWLYGVFLFTLAAATLLTSVTTYALDAKFKPVKIYFMCMCVAFVGYSVGIMYQHPLTVTQIPCPSNQYGSVNTSSNDCLPCDCVNGVCDEGREGTGACFCFPRWAGDRCDVCAPHVVSVESLGSPTCDFCEVGWHYETDCTTCYPGYTGDNCTQCAAHTQTWQIPLDKIRGGDAGSPYDRTKGGLNPWHEARQDMVWINDVPDGVLPVVPNEMYGYDYVLRCDGCVSEDMREYGAAYETDRNTRHCAVADCTSDPLSTVKPNAFPPEITLSDTVCYDDFDCEYSWLCVKPSRARVTGYCASLPREAYGCDCGSIGATGPSCLFCDQISIRSCGEGTCVWTQTGETPLEGYVGCACKTDWYRYPKNLVDRGGERDGGALNLFNASCTLQSADGETTCMDTTFGQYCLPCECGNRGTCADGYDGDGTCTCVLDSVFGGRGMWQGEKCDTCFQNCSLNLKSEEEGCVPLCDDPLGYEEGRRYCKPALTEPQTCLFRDDR